MDVRWAFRLILKHPGFALGVVAVLGLGLGANVAVYSVVDGTFRNTSWWNAPDRTLSVWPERKWSFGMMELYRENEHAFRSLGGYVEAAYALRTPRDGSESVNGVAITPELFRELSVQPVLGRALEDDDAFLGVEPVAVLGEALWRRSFGADPGVLGSTVDVSGTTARVVGIQRMGSRAPGGRAEIWLPLVVDPREDDYFKAVDLKLVGVLADGFTSADAATRSARSTPTWPASSPTSSGPTGTTASCGWPAPTPRSEAWFPHRCSSCWAPPRSSCSSRR